MSECFDARMQHNALSFLQARKSDVSKAKANEDLVMAFEAQESANGGLSLLQEGLSIVPGKKLILDACCGSRMFWFNKEHPLVEYSDIRADVVPDIIQDFRKLEYPDHSFKLVVFDPPHLFKKTPWIRERYGILLQQQWPKDIKEGFDECMRVLEDYGILIFKWSQGSISVSTVLAVLGVEPLFGHTSDKKSNTHWMCFMKIPK